MEMTAAVEADALADERNRVGTAFATVPSHHHDLGLMHRALADAEKRPHAELLHGRHVKNLDEHAKFSQVASAARELPRIKHIGRLVDEVARQDHTVGKTSDGGPGLFRGGRIGAGEIDLHLGRPLLAFLGLGFIPIEAVRAQTHTEHQTCNLVTLQCASRELGDDGRLRCSAGHATDGNASQPDQVAILQVSLLADSDHDQARRVQTRWRYDVESRSGLSAETIHSRGTAHVIADR